MYAKLENNKIIYPPKNYDNGENLILNFNKNIELMKQYGFKKVVDNQPAYNHSTHYTAISEYIEDDNTITINYELKEIETGDNIFTLEERIAELEKVNKGQEILINTLMLAADEMYMMLEPLLAETVSKKSKSKMVDMYVATVQKGIRIIDQVPVRYRKQVKEILNKNSNKKIK